MIASLLLLPNRWGLPTRAMYAINSFFRTCKDRDVFFVETASLLLLVLLVLLVKFCYVLTCRGFWHITFLASNVSRHRRHFAQKLITSSATPGFYIPPLLCWLCGIKHGWEGGGVGGQDNKLRRRTVAENSGHVEVKVRPR